MKSNSTWLLTTEDNQYNPFTEWDLWLARDLELGHNTCSLLARLSKPADELNDDITDYMAMMEIVTYNWSGVHLMVTRDTWFDLMAASKEQSN